jgi:hypothetical protein
MNNRTALTGRLLSRKGEALPPPEPKTAAILKKEGRRVSTTLPIEIYVLFKARVARAGITGEQAILGAIKRMLSDD